MFKAAADTEAGKKGAGVSEDLNDLRGRLLARQRRSRSRSRAMGGLVLAVVASSLALAAVPLWQHVGSWKPMASHAGSVIQAAGRDLLRAPAESSLQHADPEPLASD